MALLEMLRMSTVNVWLKRREENWTLMIRSLTVNLMEGQSAEIVNIAPMCKYQLIYHISCSL